MQAIVRMIIVGIVCFFVGILITTLVLKTSGVKVEPPQSQEGLSEARLGQGKLTNPLLECNVNQDIGEREFSGLEADINDFILSMKKDGSVKEVAVYYRDLNNGPWFGVNERSSFSPSSLLKLPVMLAYYKQAEIDPDLLKRKIEFPGNLDVLPQDIKPSEQLKKGESYTIEDLVYRMIVYSDNNSLKLLEDNIDNYLIDRVTLDLGIPTATDTTPEDYLSVKDYSSLFRVLFNGSYLRPAHSEKALDILTRTDFIEGMRSGVPDKKILVAHKMGERDLGNGVRQLHDCGIVYFPGHPYLLCVMTRGSSFESLTVVIKDLSEKVYKEVSRRYPKSLSYREH